MIEVDHLRKCYGAREAVKDISFRVEKGEIVGFLGPNGAGKTTTMRILANYLSATGGTAKIAGFDVFEHPLEVRRRLGYMPENVSLYREMPVHAMLIFAARAKGMSRKDAEADAARIMDRCGLSHVATRPIGKLSKGYRQRVGLAQALAGNPDVLILDEPTSGLDPKQIVEVRELIRSLGKSHTVILSTHVLPEVGMTCGRVIIVNEGRVVEEDTPENLATKLQRTRILTLRVKGPLQQIITTLRSLKSVHKAICRESADDRHLIEAQCALDEESALSVSRRIVESGWGLLEMTPQAMSLEQIFIQLVDQEKGEPPA